MEKYNFTIKRRFYPGREDLIPTTLPNGYVHKNKGANPMTQECLNCYFNNAGFCDYWKAPIRDNYWCKKWSSQLTPFNDLPEPPPCLTGYTLPILLTQDFNDIGVYTPWDGLILQRDVINNFVYTGFNQSICVFNTSDLEFKRFLNFADYKVDWGDGTPIDYLNNNATEVCHNYVATNSTGYTVTLSQTNPWGTTHIKKIINLPYYENPIIPNVFGTISFAPPNIGDPIGCEYIDQNYIFSGDSNPDVYDHFSMRYVNTPYPVTGYTDTTKIHTFAQYGPNYLPPTGVQINLPDEAVGTITDITPSYTSYTINYVNYIDYSGGTTYFEAMSFGLNQENLDYVCCTDEEIEEMPCPCDPSPTGVWTGNWSTPLPATGYVFGDVVMAQDNRCYWKNDVGYGSIDPAAFNGVEEWYPCAGTPGSGPGPGSPSALITSTTSNNGNYSPYSSSVGYSTQDIVSYDNNLYGYGGRVEYGNLSETVQSSPYIDLRYMDGNAQVPYINDKGEPYGLCLSTPPNFDPQDWENKSGDHYNRYVTIWNAL